MDSELACRVLEPEAGAGPQALPLVYFPLVDFEKLDDPSIIDAF